MRAPRGSLAAAAVTATLAPVLAFLVSIFFPVRSSREIRILMDSLGKALVSETLVSALRFSLIQATASTLLAFLIALPGAYFVAKFRFRGRRLLLALSAVPFSLPPILVILAFVLYFGKSGYFTEILHLITPGATSGGRFLYGLGGLVVVHAFYNFPLILQGVGAVWANLPGSREEAARVLGAGRFRSFATGTLPYLLPSIVQSLGIVFLFCFFSFTLVLVFGGLGGSTMEVAIYRALKFTGDKPLAAALALVQTLIALGVILILARFERIYPGGTKDFGATKPARVPGFPGRSAILLYFSLIAVFFFGPLISLALEAFRVRTAHGSGSAFGLANFSRLFSGSSANFAEAVWSSLAIGGAAALLATTAGLGFIASIRAGGASGENRRARTRGIRRWRRSRDRDACLVLASIPLAISPAIVAAGWARLVSSGSVSAVLFGQAAITWPFVARYLSGPFESIGPHTAEAARMLGSSERDAFLRVEAALIAPSIASAAAFAFAIALGDANIPLIAGGGQVETLPLLVYRLTSSYRFSEACAAGVVLAALAGLAFYAKERIDGVSGN